MNKKTLFSFLLSGIIFLPLIVVAAAGAGAGTSVLYDLVDSIKTAAETVGGLLAILGFLIAAILWLTSGGSPERTGLARKALIAAVIGTVILVIAQGSDRFVTMISQILGTDK